MFHQDLDYNMGGAAGAAGMYGSYIPHTTMNTREELVALEMRNQCGIPAQFASVKLSDLPQGKDAIELLKKIEPGLGIHISGKEHRKYGYALLRTAKLLNPRSRAIALGYGDILESYKAQDGLPRDSSLSTKPDSWLLGITNADFIYFTDFDIGQGVNILTKKERTLVERYLLDRQSAGALVIISTFDHIGFDSDWGADMRSLAGVVSKSIVLK